MPLGNIEKNRELRIKSYGRYARLRNKVKKKDSEICTLTGIAPQTMWAWSKGDYTPKLDKMLQIANAIGVSLDELVGVK